MKVVIMRIELTKRPSSPTIIVGFPGVGLVGPIVTEFLIDHMKTEVMGKFVYDELPATAAVHKGALVHPMSLHYSEKHNALIAYTVLNVRKEEWAVAGVLAQLAKDLGAKEIICIDGANAASEESIIYAFGNPQFTQLGAQQMQESVIMGVSAALMLIHPNTSCLFATTHSEFPDSKAAAEIVKFLDKYMGLEVDYHPLVEQATQFEQKLKSMMGQSQKMLSEQDKKSMDYFG
jgi:uncharacterized protein